MLYNIVNQPGFTNHNDKEPITNSNASISSSCYNTNQLPKSGPSNFFRMLYLKREYTRLETATSELQGCFVVPNLLSGKNNDEWKGLIFIRGKSSPWYKGAFAFTILFPPGYPFEPPVAKFDKPFAAHHLLPDGMTVPFETEFMMISAMQTSVLAKLIKCIRRLFLEDTNDPMILEAAQADVKRCSITADERAVYKKVFGEESYMWLLELDDTIKKGSDLDTAVAKWNTYGKHH